VNEERDLSGNDARALHRTREGPEAIARPLRQRGSESKRDDVDEPKRALGVKAVP
jgi:hypothetical protein